MDSYKKPTVTWMRFIFGAGHLVLSTTGAFDETDWQPIQGDIQLRDDVTKGTSLIRDVKHVASVIALRALPGSYDGQQISIRLLRWQQKAAAY